MFNEHQYSISHPDRFDGKAGLPQEFQTGLNKFFLDFEVTPAERDWLLADANKLYVERVDAISVNGKALSEKQVLKLERGIIEELRRKIARGELKKALDALPEEKRKFIDPDKIDI